MTDFRKKGRSTRNQGPDMSVGFLTPVRVGTVSPFPVEEKLEILNPYSLLIL